ncbi:MAG: hypothetical protein ABR912_00440 [Terracidiphilus sp.]|jgi:hypothetical protein
MARPRFSLTLVSVFILASAATGLAQRGSDVPIEPLLRSHDPRLVALGAWKAGGRGNDAEIAIMQEMVERWDPAQRHRYQDGDRYDAMTAILDTLIQRNEFVSPAGVSAIAYAFPDQALILAARLPFNDAEPLLLSWYENGVGVRPAQGDREGEDRLMMARVAAMMLAKERPQDIAARILVDSLERLAVSVPNEGYAGVDRCLVDCVAKPGCQWEAGGMPRVGWPTLFLYTVEENRPDADNTGPLVAGPLLVEAGDDRITYRRVETEVSLNYCYSPLPLNAATRHRLLAEMLGVDDKQMPWSVQENITVPWVNDSQFLLDLSKQVYLEESQLRATVQRLYAKGLLTRTEAASIRPKLSIIVFDDRQPTEPANAALPQLQVQDSRTSYRISQWR